MFVRDALYASFVPGEDGTEPVTEAPEPGERLWLERLSHMDLRTVMKKIQCPAGRWPGHVHKGGI